jgi:predicted TIM-barrel fold metal-dependent hydrolase
VISFIKTTPILRFINYIVSLVLTFNVILFIADWSGIRGSTSWFQKLISILEASFGKYLLFDNISTIYKVAIIFALFFLYPQIAKLLFSLASKLISQLKYLPSKKMLQFIQRYLTIAEFAKYKTQKSIFDRLIKMYEPGSKVVVLPMDMEYMKAWRPKQSYLEQLSDINRNIKNKDTNVEYLIPFVFVDPRRIGDKKNSKDRKFFDWDWEKRNVNGESKNWVILKDCILKDCLEGDSTSGELKGYYKGIKIYPALGYYPFDEDLLPLWIYCQQHNLPITTHCIEGTIFYRGNIKRKWMYHPVFRDSNDNRLITKVKTNYELQINFTHPLNYLVLLEEYYLAKTVGDASDKVKQLFGFDEADGSINQNLAALKINLAHYGGKEQWLSYLEDDRVDLSAELMENPERGAELFREQKAVNGVHPLLYSKPAWIWNQDFEWFTIISSLMLQYPNVYADISYILHAEEVKPLLSQVLKTNKKLASKILFGTDFFVVRNHKSEKELYAELLANIGIESMKLIARVNPDKFLRNSSN